MLNVNCNAYNYSVIYAKKIDCLIWVFFFSSVEAKVIASTKDFVLFFTHQRGWHL